MKQTIKRTLAVILAAVMLTSMMSLFSCSMLDNQPETDDSHNSTKILTIEEQICAFAKSVDTSNADYLAAIALAKHGIAGDGKKLSVDQNHPLTATLMNAELSMTTIIDGCTVAIEKMQEMHLSSIFGDAGCYFGMNEKYYNVAALYREGDSDGVGTDVLKITKLIDYNGPLNSYDSSLVWMTGSTEIHIYITQSDVTADMITYSVKVVFADDFDFNTSEGSVTREIVSVLGSVIFREYRWNATVEFSLTIPRY